MWSRQRVAVLTVGAVVVPVLLFVAGCGQASPGSGAGRSSSVAQRTSTSAAPSTTPSTSNPPGIASGEPAPVPPIARGPLVPDAQLDTSGLPAEHPVVVWTEDSGRTVGLLGVDGGCTQISATVVEQNATSVRVAFVETTAGNHQICSAQRRDVVLTVPLDGPLGSRTVILELRRQIAG